uniref:RNA pseudouridine synthase domain containing 2 n=1 Tax=Amazona collaria TaxID=241587 RepID=A0A8B9G4Y4_9PSIT
MDTSDVTSESSWVALATEGVAPAAGPGEALGAGSPFPPLGPGMAEPGPGPGQEQQSGPAGKEEAAPAPKKRRLAGGERYVPPPRKLNTGVSFGAAHFAETSYYFEGGLRKVRPYYFDFRTYCKGRWVGRSLLHVFSTEFRAQPLAYYRAAARAGRLRLNEQPVRDLDVVLKVRSKGSSFGRNKHKFSAELVVTFLFLLGEA